MLGQKGAGERLPGSGCLSQARGESTHQEQKPKNLWGPGGTRLESQRWEDQGSI